MESEQNLDELDGYYAIQSHRFNEYLYVGKPQLANDKKHVLLFNQGDPSNDADMRMMIKKFPAGYYGIKSVRFNQWLYAGKPKLDDQRRYVLCFSKNTPEKDKDMRWNIVRMEGNQYSIQSVQLKEYVYSGEPMYDKERRHVLTFNQGTPQEDQDMVWNILPIDENGQPKEVPKKAEEEETAAKKEEEEEKQVEVEQVPKKEEKQKDDKQKKDSKSKEKKEDKKDKKKDEKKETKKEDKKEKKPEPKKEEKPKEEKPKEEKPKEDPKEKARQAKEKKEAEEKAKADKAKQDAENAKKKKEQEEKAKEDKAKKDAENAKKEEEKKQKEAQAKAEKEKKAAEKAAADEKKAAEKAAADEKKKQEKAAADEKKRQQQEAEAARKEQERQQKEAQLKAEKEKKAQEKAAAEEKKRQDKIAAEEKKKQEKAAAEERKRQQKEADKSLNKQQLAEEKKRRAEEQREREKDAAAQAAVQAEEDRKRKMEQMQRMEEESELESKHGDLKERGKKDQVMRNIKKSRKKADKFCSKFCFTFWVTFPSILQTIFLFAQELINIYIVGRSGDYLFIDVVGMSNILVYFIVFGTAIVFNGVLETLVPHALATNRVELSGHILNRGLFLWTVLFFFMVIAAMNSGFILSNILGQDEEDAYMTQEYLVHLCPSLWFWGICDAYRRFFNCFHKFWTPCFTYFFTICMVHPLVCYQIVEINEMGAKGLAISGFITNFLTYLIMRIIQHKNVRMKPASFCPTFKTCFNLCQYLYYGIPQLIMFWIDTWQWQLLAFVTGWFGVTEQYTTITLLGAMMFCLIVGYSLASTGATLCGQEIGCANVTAAKYYYRSVLIFQITISILECIGLQIYLGFMLDHITEDINMQDTILTVYQLFIFNVFLDSIRAMLKGFLRGLGIQNSVLPYHIFIQGAIMPGAISVLCFNMPSMEDTPVLGAWIATTICDFLLFLGYFITLQRANWHEISINVVKRVNQIAGTNPDEDVFDDNGEHIEMQKRLM